MDPIAVGERTCAFQACLAERRRQGADEVFQRYNRRCCECDCLVPYDIVLPRYPLKCSCDHHSFKHVKVPFCEVFSFGAEGLAGLQLELDEKVREARCSRICHDSLQVILPPQLLPVISIFVELLGAPSPPAFSYEDLLLQHPLAFRDYSVPPGFDFGEGWFVILKELLRGLERLNDALHRANVLRGSSLTTTDCKFIYTYGKQKYGSMRLQIAKIGDISEEIPRPDPITRAHILERLTVEGKSKESTKSKSQTVGWCCSSSSSVDVGPSVEGERPHPPSLHRSGSLNHSSRSLLATSVREKGGPQSWIELAHELETRALTKAEHTCEMCGSTDGASRDTMRGFIAVRCGGCKRKGSKEEKAREGDAV